MNLQENINRVRGIMGIISESFDIPDNIKSMLKNKALVYNFPYADNSVIIENAPWFSVIIYPKTIDNKIKRILIPFLEKSDLYYNITTKDDIKYDNVNYGKLYDNLVKVAHSMVGKKVDDENNKTMVIYFSPNTSKEVNNNKKLYHVTYSPMVEVEGLVVKTTVKYKDRIYLWDDLDTAINYVDISHHKNKNDAWVYEVDASGMDLFKDPEEASKSFYVENNIPPSRLKLVYKSK
jgi:hypothetical protein